MTLCQRKILSNSWQIGLKVWALRGIVRSIYATKIVAKEKIKRGNILQGVAITTALIHPLITIRDKNRNCKINFRENIMIIACCLHNFRLQFRLKKQTIS
jgi:hypothetical protein